MLLENKLKILLKNLLNVVLLLTLSKYPITVGKVYDMNNHRHIPLNMMLFLIFY